MSASTKQLLYAVYPRVYAFCPLEKIFLRDSSSCGVINTEIDILRADGQGLVNWPSRGLYFMFIEVRLCNRSRLHRFLCGCDGMPELQVICPYYMPAFCPYLPVFYVSHLNTAPQAPLFVVRYAKGGVVNG